MGCLSSVGDKIIVYSTDDFIRDLDIKTELHLWTTQARLQETAKVKSEIIRK